MESNICRWFTQVDASENCLFKSSLKAESTQLLSDVKQYLAKACKMTGTINIPNNCLAASSLEKIHSCQACSIQCKKKFLTQKYYLQLCFQFPSCPAVALKLPWLKELIEFCFAMKKLGLDGKFKRHCSSFYFFHNRTPFIITVLTYKDLNIQTQCGLCGNTITLVWYFP